MTGKENWEINKWLIQEPKLLQLLQFDHVHLAEVVSIKIYFTLEMVDPKSIEL